jgi:hypothetical protein
MARAPRRAAACILAAGLAAAAAAPARAGAAAADFTKHTISNPKVTLTVYRPDPEFGYYRGTRFDHAGIIARVECGGHVYYGEWKDAPRNPEEHDAVVGPAEEFGMHQPIDFADARPGDPFLKIGVGLLEKDRGGDDAYGFWKKYAFAKRGTWTVRMGMDIIQFQQELSTPTGRAYRYTKKISLQPDPPSFIIHHKLQNTGTKPLTTDHYNHNFTIIDNTPIGPDYRLVYPFDLTAKTPDKLEGLAQVKGKEITFASEIPKGKALFTELEGFRGGTEEHALTIENRKTGGGLRIQGDRPPIQCVLYAQRLCVCPEFFITVDVPPGGEMEWRTKYILTSGETKGGGQ